MDEVLLVVEGQGVEHEVHAEPERELALAAAPGLDRAAPLAELVARERAEQVDVEIAYLMKIGSLYEDALREPEHAVHAYKRVPQSWCVEWMANADLSRELWAPAQRLCDDVSVEKLKGSPHIHGGTPILISGARRL